jgi:hypothetical protein
MRACTRCNGFLMIENWLDLCRIGKQSQLQRTRCVNCGAIDDPVILANRRRPYHAGVEDRAKGRGRPVPRESSLAQ